MEQKQMEWVLPRLESGVEESGATVGDIIHRPVMVKEVLELLDINPSGTYVDATVGCGGHAMEILKRLKGGLLICLDWDSEVLKIAEERLEGFHNKVLINESYTNLPLVLKKQGIGEVDGILFDLGVSTYHLLYSHRGFGFQDDDSLDMRYNRSGRLTAYDVVNKFPLSKLERIFKEYGEEKFYKRIARKIVDERLRNEIKTARQLSSLIERIVPKRKTHPATKVFQALRIYVNNELENIKVGLQNSYRVLKPGGRIVVISFHSLEDRIVKYFFKTHPFEILTKKPLVPSDEEIKENPRSRSAKLRAAKKLDG